MAVVPVLMSHDMESGQRTYAAGTTVAAWHITQGVASLDGKPALATQWGTPIARDPLTQFNIEGSMSGARISVAWTDNRGNSRTDEAVVARRERSPMGVPRTG